MPTDTTPDVTDSGRVAGSAEPSDRAARELIAWMVDVVDVLREHAPRLITHAPHRTSPTRPRTTNPHPFDAAIDRNGRPMEICSRCRQWSADPIHNTPDAAGQSESTRPSADVD